MRGRGPAVVAIALLHAAAAAWLAAAALQGLSIGSGRAPLSSLLAPADLTALLTGEPSPWKMVIALAGVAGAAFAPWLHRNVRSVAAASRRPLPAAAAAGIAHACAVTIATAAAWMLYVGIVFRASDQSIASAVAGTVAATVLGMPLLATTLLILFLPVVLGGGAAVGMAALAVERRRAPPHSSSSTVASSTMTS